MEFAEVVAVDGAPVFGLLSPAPDRPVACVLHVHGYGGDMYSNRFVRHLHRGLPPLGVSFCSVQLRTAAYVAEQYSDGNVRYVGSALVDPEEALLDIDAMIKVLAAEQGVPVVVQGHSFGTNLAKVWAATRSFAGKCIFIAPGDSEALQVEFEMGDPGSTDLHSLGLSWSIFGIASGDYRYPIPIDVNLFASLRTGRVFRTWSPGADELQNASLVLRCTDDPIANEGAMGDASYLRQLLPAHILREFPGTSHSLAGHEDMLTTSIAEFVRSGDVTG